MTTRAISAQDFAESYSMPVKTVYKLIRQRRIRAINYGTQLRPRYRISVVECARFEATA